MRLAVLRSRQRNRLLRALLNALGGRCRYRVCVLRRRPVIFIDMGVLPLNVGLTGGRASLACGKLHLLLRGVWLPASHLVLLVNLCLWLAAQRL